MLREVGATALNSNKLTSFSQMLKCKTFYSWTCPGFALSGFQRATKGSSINYDTPLGGGVVLCVMHKLQAGNSLYMLTL